MLLSHITRYVWKRPIVRQTGRDIDKASANRQGQVTARQAIEIEVGLTPKYGASEPVSPLDVPRGYTQKLC